MFVPDYISSLLLGCSNPRPAMSGYQIGYNELRTNLPGGRQLFIMDLKNNTEYQATNMKTGHVGILAAREKIRSNTKHSDK